MARIVHKTLGDATEAELVRLEELTIQGASGMTQDVIAAAWNSETTNLHEFQIFLARVEDTVLGWATLFPFRKTKAYEAEEDRADHYLVYIYVEKDQRSSGIGQQLFGRVRNFVDKYKIDALVFPWDHNSRAFYEKCFDRKPTERIKKF